MNGTKGISRNMMFAALLAGALFALPTNAHAARAAAVEDSGAISRLDKPQFKDVKVSVDNGIATLTGSVSLFEYKADAGKRILKAKGVSGVRNLIEVAGPTVADKELQEKIVQRLAYERVGYSNLFDAITVNVNDGVVTLGGHARQEVDKDTALSLVATCPGVKDVSEDIAVDPVSPMDDRIRMEVARAIYSFPALERYAVDPARPIRISVQNGNVELYGTVDNDNDKQIAYTRANSISGVFSVKNYLNVANEGSEGQKQQ